MGLGESGGGSITQVLGEDDQRRVLERAKGDTWLSQVQEKLSIVYTQIFIYISGKTGDLALRVEKETRDGRTGGRANIMSAIAKAGFAGEGEQSSALQQRSAAILARVKQLESMGYSFEGADASVEASSASDRRVYVSESG